jgi:hypothetical protein
MNLGYYLIKENNIRGDSMKTLIVLACIVTSTFAMAKEVETECLAMNENREKIIKTDKPKVKTVKGSSQQ